MTNHARLQVVRPVEPEPGVLVHTASDRRLAVEHWLLSTCEDRGYAREEWQQHQVALLPLGGLFSAVRIPGRLVRGLAESHDPETVDEWLDQVLDGGPVICDARGDRYYALVPASMPRTWHQAADDWRTMDVDCLGRGSHLLVPRVDLVEYDSRLCRAYWSVPMSSAGILCATLHVARLVATARHHVPDELEV
ncbi:hypothetical protein ACFCYB_24980 [Streptomyces sp. NPDC056309]|uniref:hypothetical protein n=1 Tax=unclassified Streptomyces TaxID=2593676 RepID=UPI0035DD6B5F